MPGLRVVILSGYASPKTLEFEESQQEIRIGRAAEAEVRLDPARDVACSRSVHARLVRGKAGAWELECVHGSGVGIVGPSDRVVRRLAEGETAPVAEGLTFEVGVNGPRINAADPSAPLPVTNIKRSSGAPLPHVPADVVGKARSSARWMRIGAPVGLLALIGIAIGVAVVNRASHERDVSQDDSIRETRQATEEVRQKVALHEASLEETRAALGQARDAISEVRALAEQTKEQVAGIAEEIERDFATTLQEARRSVALVGIVDAQDDFTMVGTAWVVEPTRLATNAHVALGLAEQLKFLGADGTSQGLRMVARVPGASSRDVEIVGTQVHPGHAEFEEFMAQHIVDFHKRMFARQAAGDQVEFVQFGVAYDVALLDLSTSIGPALVLADEVELRALGPGQEIAYIGFPSENVLDSRVNTPPSVHVGRLTNLTNVFSQAGPFEESLLLHHSLPTVGGASGSPIFNRGGHVVGLVSHGSAQFVKTATGDPARVMVGFNFGQRVNTLGELRDGSAFREDQRAARAASWTRDLAEIKPVVPEERATMRANLAAYYRSQAVREWNVDLRSASLTPVQVVQGPVGANTQVASAQFTLPTGVYIICAAGQSRADMRLVVQVGQDAPLATDEYVESVESTAIMINAGAGNAPVVVEIEFVPATADADFVAVIVFRMQ